MTNHLGCGSVIASSICRNPQLKSNRCSMICPIDLISPGIARMSPVRENHKLSISKAGRSLTHREIRPAPGVRSSGETIDSLPLVWHLWSATYISSATKCRRQTSTQAETKWHPPLTHSSLVGDSDDWVYSAHLLHTLQGVLSSTSPATEPCVTGHDHQRLVMAVGDRNPGTLFSTKISPKI